MKKNQFMNLTFYEDEVELKTLFRLEIILILPEQLIISCPFLNPKQNSAAIA